MLILEAAVKYFPVVLSVQDPYSLAFRFYVTYSIFILFISCFTSYIAFFNLQRVKLLVWDAFLIPLSYLGLVGLTIVFEENVVFSFFLSYALIWVIGCFYSTTQLFNKFKNNFIE